jgi:hypothetical protein
MSDLWIVLEVDDEDSTGTADFSSAPDSIPAFNLNGISFDSLVSKNSLFSFMLLPMHLGRAHRGAGMFERFGRYVYCQNIRTGRMSRVKIATRSKGSFHSIFRQDEDQAVRLPLDGGRRLGVETIS